MVLMLLDPKAVKDAIITKYREGFFILAGNINDIQEFEDTFFIGQDSANFVMICNGTYNGTVMMCKPTRRMFQLIPELRPQATVLCGKLERTPDLDINIWVTEARPGCNIEEEFAKLAEEAAAHLAVSNGRM